jgi:hypothetical protein
MLLGGGCAQAGWLGLTSGSEAPGCFVWSVWSGQCCGDRRGEEGEMIDRRGYRGRWDDTIVRGARERKVSGSSDCWYRGHFPMVECIGILGGVFTQVFLGGMMCGLWWFDFRCGEAEISSFPAKRTAIVHGDRSQLRG